MWFITLQAELARSMVETTLRSASLLAEAGALANRQATSFWMDAWQAGLAGGGWPAAVSRSNALVPFWPTAPMAPMLTAQQAWPAMYGAGLWPAASWGAPALAMAWAPWLMSQRPLIPFWPMLAPRPETPFDAVATAYRTASGHAAAAIITPFVPPALAGWWRLGTGH